MESTNRSIVQTLIQASTVTAVAIACSAGVSATSTKIITAVKAKGLPDRSRLESRAVRQNPVAPQLNVEGIAVPWPPSNQTGRGQQALGFTERAWCPAAAQSLGISQESYWAKKVLTTEHKDYVVNARQSKEARAIIPGATIALTSSDSRDTPGVR